MSTLRTKAGQLVTDEMIEALAAEAEAGYDLTAAERRDVGRPSLGDGISPRLQFRVDRPTYSAAKAQAVIEGRTVSEVARSALERYLTEAPGAQGRQAPALPKTYHVMPVAKRGWAVRAAGASRPSGYYQTRRAALEAAAHRIRRTGGGIVIHSANGRVRRVTSVAKLA